MDMSFDDTENERRPKREALLINRTGEEWDYQARLAHEILILRGICAQAYQLVGALSSMLEEPDYVPVNTYKLYEEESVRGLDILSAASDDEPIPHEGKIQKGWTWDS